MQKKKYLINSVFYCLIRILIHKQIAAYKRSIIDSYDEKEFSILL